MKFRLRTLFIIAIVLGICVGIALPKISRPFAQITGQYVATGPAADVLESLRVDDHPRASAYNRDAFHYNTVDYDGDGCTVRDDVLRRDMSDVTYTGAAACHIGSGVLQDPYTGHEIDFVRGKATSSAVQIDHVVALENAWQSGANRWGTEKLEQYGNDMYNLLAVDGPANQEKGSASAAYWLPSNHKFRCAYVARQIGVKSKYGLSVTSQEKQAIGAVLRSCPSQDVPNQ